MKLTNCVFCGKPLDVHKHNPFDKTACKGGSVTIEKGSGPGYSVIAPPGYVFADGSHGFDARTKAEAALKLDEKTPLQSCPDEDCFCQEGL